MHACIHKASGFIGGKGPRSLKKLPFCHTMVMLDYVIVRYKVICILCSHCLRLVAIGYNYVTLP